MKVKFILVIMCILFLVAFARADTFDFNLHYIDGYYDDGRSQPGWVRAGDIDKDGDLDIVAGGNFSLYVYENKGKEWQKYGNLDSEGMGSNAAVLYDVNSDGYLDVVSGKYWGSLGWWENPGSLGPIWKFHEIRKASFFLRNLVLVDLDQDGKIEEFIAGWYNSYWNEISQLRLEWLKPQQSGQSWENHVIEPNRIGFNHNHAGLDTGDVDKDGNIDIAYSNGWYKAPEKPEESWIWYPATNDVINISNTILQDMDNDKDLDLVISSGHHGRGVYWLENSNPKSDSWTKHIIDNNVIHPEGLAVLDLDEDGDFDIIVSEIFVDNWKQKIHNLYFFENQRDSWEKHNIAPDSYPGHLIQIADINNDGKQDIISEGAGCNIVSYYENAGQRTEPGIDSLSGTLEHQNTITITGSHFGSHIDNSLFDTTTLALRFDDFENGKTGFQISDSWRLSKGEFSEGSYSDPTYCDTNQRDGSIQSTMHDFAYDSEEFSRESGFGLIVDSGWQEVYVSYWRRLDVLDVGNLIDFEMTGNSGTKTGDQGPGVPIMTHQEVINLQADYNDPYPGIGGVDISNPEPWENGVWNRIEMWMRIGDSKQALKYWRNGKLLLDYESPNDFPWGIGPYLGDDNSRFNKIWFGYYTESAIDGYAQLDDVYIDISQSRIELCDSPTWYEKNLNAGHCEIQIPKSWQDDRITFTLNQGSFDTEKIYLYVVDREGNVNEEGYEIETRFLDKSPPIIRNIQPFGSLATGTDSTTLYLETDEIAECRYSATPDSMFSQMTKFMNTDSKKHSIIINVQEGGTYTYYVKCRDTKGNVNADGEIISFSINTEQQNNGGSSSSSGGSVDKDSEKIQAQTKFIDIAETGKKEELEYTIEALGITKIELIAKKKILGGRVTVKEATVNKTGLAVPSKWAVYKYLEITKDLITDEQIDSVKIYFKVNKSWYLENGYNVATTVLKKKVDDSWKSMSTKRYKEDDNYYYFYSESSTLSYFAIAAQKTSSKKLLFWFLIVSFILLLILLILFIRFKNKQSELKNL